ncbi:LysR family transcriptional regulator [Aureimonas populi]|uniref:LysR family transcriptional regulator n=1 Tax=Aureimonas populi TaxID=1701758 RepID=A0ABW5CP63_9HYPH|nr:LysR family transcriptional regulator [Aureimonas populi]
MDGTLVKTPFLKRRTVGPLHENDLRNLRVFRIVCDAGGITAAVERNGLEKSSVSRSIKSLEARLDGTLCFRGPKGFSLTDYGTKVYAAASSLDDALDRTRTAINAAHGLFEGEVRLGVADNCLTNPDAKISDAIEAFMKIAPAVRLSVSIYPPDQLAAALTERRLHLGVVSSELAGPGFEGIPIFTERFHLYCCPQADEAPPRLERLASRGYGIVHRAFSHDGPAGSSRHIDAAWTAQASGLEAVATLVNTGRYVGFLPDHYVEGIRTRRPFVEVPGSSHLSLETVFCVVTERDRSISQASNAMKETIVRVARQMGTARAAQALCDGR